MIFQRYVKLSAWMFVFCFAFGITSNNFAHALNEAPRSFTLDGRIFSSPTSTTPLLGAVTINVKILDPTATCVLYEEAQPFDTTTTNGYFNIAVGSSVADPKRVGDDPNHTMETVYQNKSVISAVNAGCGAGFTPAAGDTRLVRITVTPTLTGIAQVFTPDMRLDAVPTAVVAESIQGLSRDNMLELNTNIELTQANIENVFSVANYPVLTSLLAGTSSLYMKAAPTSSVSFNGQQITNVAAPTLGTDAANKSYADGYIGGKAADGVVLGAIAAGDAGKVMVWDGAKWTAAAPAGDATKLPLAGGTMTGAINMGSQNLLATGHVTMSSQTTLNLGTYTNGQEAVLVLGLGAPDKGKFWYNTDLPGLKVWDGGVAVAVQQSGSAAGGDLTGTYPNPTIAANAVVASKLNDGAVTSAKILDGTIVGSDIANSTVSDANISGVGAGKITSGAGVYLTYAPNGAACADGEYMRWDNTNARWVCGVPTDTGITTLTGDISASGSGSVAASIVAGAVVTAKIADANVTTAKLADGAVTDVKIADVSYSKLTNASGVYLNYLPNNVACANGQILSWDNVNSRWVCAADADTGMTALTGDVTGTGSGSVATTIANNAIVAAKLNDDAVTTSKILNGAVTDAKINDVAVSKITSASGQYFGYLPNGTACADGQILSWDNANSRWVCASGAVGSVTSVATGTGLTGGTITTTGTISIAAGGVSATELAADAVTSAKILDGTIALADLAADSVDSSKIVDGTIVTADLADNAVTANKINALAVTTPKMFAVPGANYIVMTDGVSGNTLVAKSCGVGKVLKWTLTGWDCDDDLNSGGTVTGIATGTGLAGGPISGVGTISIAAGGVSATELAANAVVASKINDGAVTSTGILDGTIATIDVANNAIVAAKINDGAVTSTGIFDGTIATVDVANNAVTDAKINDVSYAKLSNANGVYLTYKPNDVACGDGQILSWDNANARWVCSSDAGGTVTNIATGTGLAGGPITGVGTISIAAGGVSATELAANAVVASKINDGAVTSTGILDGTIATGDVAAKAITTALINDSAVTALQLNDDAVTSAKILDGTIATADIANNAIVAGKINDGAVTSTGILDGTIATVDVAAKAITTALINDSAVTALQLNADAVTTAKILDGTIATSDVANKAVTTALINDSAITNLQLIDDAVTSSKILDGTIATADVANNAVTSAKINDLDIEKLTFANTKYFKYMPNGVACADGQVLSWDNANSRWVCAVPTAGAVTGIATGTGLAGGPITGVGTVSIAAGGVSSTELAANAVVASKINDGAVTSTGILDGTIATVDVAAKAIATALINDSAVTALQLNDDAVTSAKILDGTIATADIANNAVVASKINDGAVTSTGILDGTIATVDVAAKAVTTALINDSAVTTLQLNNDAVTTAKILDGTIVTADVSNNAVTSAKINDLDIEKLTFANTKYFKYMPNGVACADGQVLSWDNANSRWVCAVPTAGAVTGIATGTGLAGGPITGVGTVSIAAGGVSSTEIAANAVVASKINDGAVTSTGILDGTIATVDVAAKAITTALINDSAVTALQLNDDAVTSAKILDGTIATADIANNAIVASKINDGAVTSTGILDGTIATVDVAGKAITTALINDSAVNTLQLASLAVTDSKINDVGIEKLTFANTKYFKYMPNGVACADGQVLSWDNANSRWVCAVPTAGAVTGIATGTGLAGGPISGVGTISIAAGGVGTTELAANAVVASKINDGAVTSTGILDGTIATVDVAAKAITSALINDSAVTALQLNDDAVTSAKILDGTIATADISNNAIVAAKINDGAVTSTGILDGTIATVDVAAKAITTVLINDSAVATLQLNDDAVTTAKILDGTIATADVANNAVTSAKINDLDIEKLTFANTKYFKYMPNGVACADGQVLSWDNANSRWVCAVPTAGAVTGIATGTGLAGGPITGVGTVSIAAGGVSSTELAANAVVASKINDGAVTSTGILDGTIATVDVAAKAITTALINDSAVTALQLNDDAVTSAKILDGTIATADIANNAIVAAKINDGAVTSTGILDGTIATVDVAAKAVTTALINDFAVNTLQLASLAATDAKINDVGIEKLTFANTKYFKYMPNGVACADGQVLSWDNANSRWVCAVPTAGAVTGIATGTGLAGGPITGVGTVSIAAGGVSSTELAANAVVASKINDGAVTSTGILDGTIATADIANNAVVASKINDGAVTSTGILDGTIATVDVAAKAITTALINDSAVTALQLNDDAVTSAKILDGTIATADIANNAIVAGKINDGAVTSTGILDGTIATVDVAGKAITTALINDSAVNTLQLASLAVTDSKINDVGIEKLTFANTKYFKYMPNGVACADGQVLSWDNANSRWVCAVPTAGAVTGIATGTGLAGGPISGVGTISISAGGVSSTELAANAVVASKINDGAVTSTGILDGTIATVDVAAKAVTTALINDSAVTALQLNDDAVTSAKILDGTIATADIAANAVVASKINDGAVTSTGILDGTIATVDVANNAVTSAKINDLDIEKLTFANTKYFKYMPNGVACADGQVLSWDNANSRWTCASASAGSVTGIATGTGLAGGPITGVGTVSIAAGGVSATELASNAVVAAKINNGAVTSAGILDGAIVAADLNSTITDALWSLNVNDVYRATGNVGIGTTAPSAMLTIADTSNTTGGLMVSSSNATPSATENLVKFETTNSGWDRPVLRVNDTSSNGASANIRLDSPNPDIEFVEDDQTSPAGKYEIAVQGNKFQYNSRVAADNAFETIMELSQRQQTSADVLTMNIDSNSSTRNAIKIINYTSSSGAQPGIAWRNDAGAVDNARISASSGTTHTNSKLWFEVADSAKVLQPRMVIDVAGNVGIGTTSPTSKLDVNGTITATGFSGPLTSSVVGAGTGAVGAPSISFSGDTNTGFYNATSNDTISVAAGGANIFNISSAGIVSGTSGGGLVTTANGVVGAPTYSFAGDTDTGWWSPAANTMAASTGGTERMRIDSSGYIGVGTTSPSGILDVQGGTAAASTAGTSINLVAQSGAGPGGAAGGSINLTPGAGVNGAGYGSVNITLGSTNPGWLYVLKGTSSGYTSSSGTSAYPQYNTQLSNNWVGDTNSSLQLFSTRNSGGGFQYSYIGNVAGGTNYVPAFVIGQSTGAAAYSERLRIDSSGYVGIGTTAPTSSLDVNGAINLGGLNGIRYPATDSTAGGSVAIGAGALNRQDALASTAFKNTAVGYQTLASASMTTAATENTAVGNAALSGNTTGFLNTAVGSAAFTNLTTGRFNVGLGARAGQASMTGFNNTALGSYALFADVSASDNTAVGSYALYLAGGGGATPGSGNVGVGKQAGYDITSGANNIAIGHFPTIGANITTGSNNIMVGYDVRPPSQTASNQLNIGNLIYASGLGVGTTAATGFVGIGTTAANALLTVEGVTSLAETTAPTNTANYGKLYVKSSDSKLYFMDDAGTETDLLAGGAATSVAASNGAVGTPSISFSGDPDTGLYWFGNNAVGVTAGGTAVSNFSTAGLVVGANGTVDTAWLKTVSPNAANPSYTFGSDGDTGMYRAAADTLAFTTAGAEKMRIDSSGNVGIGTTSPGYALDLAGSGAGIKDMLRLHNNVAAANDSGAQILFSANRTTSGQTNVAGIAGSITDITDGSPKGALIFSTNWNGGYAERARLNYSGAMIFGAGSSSQTPQGNINVIDNNANGTSLYLRNYRATATDPGNIVFSKDRAGNNLSANDEVGEITYNARINGAGTAIVQSSVVATDVGAATYQGLYTLKVADAGVLSDRFAILGSNVGIGTTVPTSTLHVNGSLAASSLSVSTLTAMGSGSMTYASTSASDYVPFQATGFAYSLFNYNTSPVDDYGVIQRYAVRNTAGNIQNAYMGFVSNTGAGVYTPTFVLGRQTGATAYSEDLRIDSSGNVGVGTTSPASKLDVAGTITAIGFSGPLTSSVVGAGTGAVGSPSLSFSGDTNTGFYNATSNDTISIAAGGANIFNISSAGIVSGTSGGALVTTANGVVGAPTYSFAGDPDTGWWSPSADTMAASTGGTERVRIDSSGNVGIGTTSPTSLLDVGGTISAQSIQVDGTGLEGVGIVTKDADGQPALNIFNYLGTAGQTYGYLYGAYIAVNNQAPTSSVASVAGAEIEMANAGTITNTYGLKVTTSKTGGATSTNTYGVHVGALAGTNKWAFYSSDASSNNYFAGNVGIGTTIPAANLAIAPASGNSTLLLQKSTTGYTSTDGLEISYGGNANIWNYENSALVFGTNNTENMRISSAGIVGIGTTSPNAVVEVKGEAGTSSGAVTMSATVNQTVFTTSSSMTLKAGDFIVPSTSTARFQVLEDTTGTTFKIVGMSTGTFAGETFTIFRPTLKAQSTSGTALTVRGSTGAVEVSAPTSASLVVTNSSPTANPNSSIVLKNYRAAYGGGDPAIASYVARGTASSPSAVTSGMVTMSLQGRGYASTDFWSDTIGASINFIATGNWGNSVATSDMTFNTAGPGLTEKMRLTSTGSVGIGTTAPAEKLDVNGAIKLGTTTGTNAGTLRFDGVNFQGYNGSTWQNLVVDLPASGACDSTQSYMTAGSYSYTVPASYATITIKLWGGGGAGGGLYGTTGGSGGNSSISSLSLLAGGGAGGGSINAAYGPGGAAGVASGGTTNTNGTAGSAAVAGLSGGGGAGANGGAGAIGVVGGAGLAGSAPGGGGSGTRTTDPNGGGGGGGGSYVEKVFTPATLPVGTTINDIVVGSAGVAVNTGVWSGAGAVGRVTVTCSTTGTPPANERGVLFLDTGAYTTSSSFVYNTSGNLGIGTTNPQSTLQVSGYTQLDTVTSSPPSADCDAAAEYGRMKVDTTAGSPKLYICAADGWVAFQPAGANTCPSGWTRIGDAGKKNSFCIETDERTAATYQTARDTCQAINDSQFGRAHLCAPDQWQTACVHGSGLSNMTNGWEWLNYLPDDPEGMTVGNASCSAWQDDTLATTNTYRCCM